MLDIVSSSRVDHTDRHHVEDWAPTDVQQLASLEAQNYAEHLKMTSTKHRWLPDPRPPCPGFATLGRG